MILEFELSACTMIAIPVSGLQTLEVQCVAVTADWISSVRASSVCVSVIRRKINEA